MSDEIGRIARLERQVATLTRRNTSLAGALDQLIAYVVLLKEMDAGLGPADLPENEVLYAAALTIQQSTARGQLAAIAERRLPFGGTPADQGRLAVFRAFTKGHHRVTSRSRA